MHHPLHSAVALAVALLLVAACGKAASAQCVVEDAYDPAATAGNIDASDHIVAQSFTPAESFFLDAVEVNVTLHVPSVSLLVSIQSDPTSSPGVFYDSKEVEVNEGGWVHCDFGMAVMSRFTYFIRISPQDRGLEWNYGVQDPYPRGRAYRDGGARTYNFLFRTCSPGQPRCVVHEAYDPPARADSMHTSIGVLAQSFSTSEPFTLDGVELLLDTPDYAQVTAYLQDDATGSPGVIYAVGYATFLGPGFIYFDFAPVGIVPGTSYHIRIEGNIGSSAWYYGDQDLYPGGQAFINDIVWVNDFIFRTCSNPVAVEPETWGAIKSRYRSP